MKLKKKNILISLAGIVAFALSTFLHFSRIINWAEYKSYDNRMKKTADTFAPCDDIVLVLLDQDSLDWGNETHHWGWPWPRASYGKLVDFFSRGNAASVAFDMMYTEPSIYGPADDEAFAQSCADYGRVVAAVYYNSFDDAPLVPVEPLASSVAVLGNVTSSLDSDGCARRSGFFASSQRREPGLAVASLQLSDEMPPVNSIPKAKDGGMYVRYQKDLSRFIPYSAYQILASEYAIEQAEKDGVEPDFSEDILDPSSFEGMHVFFGLFAPGLFDICTSPMSAVYPGVGVHLCQLDTILCGTYLRDVPAAVVPLLILLTASLGCLLGALSNQTQTRKIILEACLFVSIILLYIGGTYFAFAKGLVLPVTAPIGSFILAFVLSAAISYILEGRQKRYLKSAFRQYLSPAVIDNLMDNPDLLKLGGERREITAFFSDIQGFTTISEKLTPEQMTQFLNLYLSAMSDIILAHGGTIDKYEGDAIIAFWNAPLYQADHAKRGLEAALECHQKLAQMQEQLMAITNRPVKQRIGLNTGLATVGNFGSHKRFDYTMMGDTVNLASRLEGINKQFATYTMCSAETMLSAAKNGCALKFREVAHIAVVGRHEPVTVYCPMTQEAYDADKSVFALFEQAYSLFTAGNFAQAKILFEQNRGDPVSLKYVEKCSDFIDNPPKDWQGFLHATQK